MDIKLRPYQERQLKFIEERLDLTDTLSIESPTGSGKSFVIAKTAIDFIEKNPMCNVIITTGFNNLVFDLENTLMNRFGFKNTKVLIGTKACNCPVCMQNDGLKGDSIRLFTSEEKYRNCKKHIDRNSDINVCKYTYQFYHEYLSELSNSLGNAIIMNHLSFLLHQKSGSKFMENVGLVIVDEAHTFSTFYETYMRLELDENDLNALDSAINSLKSPMDKIIKINLQRNNTLPNQQVDAILNSPYFIGKNYSHESKSKIEAFFTIKPSISNYINVSNNRFVVDKFFKQFEFEYRFKFALFSATIDDFTKSMFNCKNVYSYSETERIIDYTKSEFLAIKFENFDKNLNYYDECLTVFMRYAIHKNLNAGLCLSTTIADVYSTKDTINALNESLDANNRFTIFDAWELDAFKECTGKKILIGSRRLFQGIDIQGLQFVTMNKIPFPNWDEKNQKMKDYITDNGKNGINFWNYFSVPKTVNDIVQGLGRLWRSADDWGIISIFDERIFKFSYIIKSALKSRYGIKIDILELETVSDTIDFDSIKPWECA